MLCRHFARKAGLLIADVHVGECSACMISPALMKKFVVPVISRIARELGPVRLHSCGASTHLLEAVAGIDRLQSLDLGGDTSICKTRKVFGREMLVSIAPLPRDMSADSPAPILDWAKRILEENASGDLTFVYHVEPDYNMEAICALTEFVRASTGRRPD